MYNADFFINFCEPIPDEAWGMGALVREDGTKCVLGHLGVDYKKKNPIAAALCNLISDNYPGIDITHINDGVHIDKLKEYGLFQNGPKERVLTALYKIKEKENKVKLVIIDHIIALALDGQKIEDIEYEELI